MEKIDFDITPQGPYFSIIRSAIWQSPLDMSGWKSGIDWDSIIQNYDDQSLLPLVSPVLVENNAIIGLSKEKINYLLDCVADNVRKHYQIKDSIVKVFSHLEKAGCHPVLLKGEGLAALYPQPNLRACGDIDIFVGEKDFQKACDVVTELCGLESLKHGEDNHYHSQFPFGNVVLEIHRSLGSHPDLRYQTIYDSFSALLCDRVNQDSVIIQDKLIPVPTNSFNSIYLLVHLTNHFKCEGIGLRQFVDSLYSVNKLTKSDFDFVLGWLEKLNLSHAWHTLYNVLLAQFALPMIPKISYARRSYRSISMISEYIVNSGNFGRMENWPLKAKGIPYGFQRMRLATKAYWKYFLLLRSFYPVLASKQLVKIITNAVSNRMEKC